LTTKSDQSFEYTKEINTGLKQDIRRIEKIVEQTERDSKQAQRETERDIREVRKEVDSKIKQALDNPLSK
jgi:BMFP domain-containing protein YqiC